MRSERNPSIRQIVKRSAIVLAILAIVVGGSYWQFTRLLAEVSCPNGSDSACEPDYAYVVIQTLLSFMVLAAAVAFITMIVTIIVSYIFAPYPCGVRNCQCVNHKRVVVIDNGVVAGTVAATTIALLTATLWM